MENDLVSVVIPCYNQGKYLKETVNSVLSSNYRPLEIIIINDGSTDDSLKIMEQLKVIHSEIKIINQPNGGVAKARNAGVNAALGNIILPLDGDDKIAPEYLKKGVEVLKYNPNVKVVYCKAVKFNETSEKFWKLKPFDRNQLARDNMIFVASLFWKKDFVEVGGFSEDMVMGREDWEFWIKMLKNGGDVIQLPFIGFYYRMTPESKRKKTGTNTKKKQRIDYLNAKHADFFERELNGPLRFQRTWSKPYNTIMKLLGRL